MKWIALACAACVVLLLGTAYDQLRAKDIALPAAAAARAAAMAPASGRRAELVAARRRGDAGALDRFVAAQSAAVAAQPDDVEALRLCAEALLERVWLRNRLRGLAVGVPADKELPAATAADLDRAQELLRQARAHGDDSAANWRLEACVASQRITGLGSALQWNGRIQAALQAAAARAPDDPALHVALGLRLLLAPKLFGHDPAAALQHFERAAPAMPDDERPRVFAAMAAWLLRQRQTAIQWLEQAVATNEANVYARVVLARLRRGEAAPFARDVDPAEAAAGR